MAGHSKFANIKHRKGAQDKKRASIFTKLAKEIVVATKMGGDNAEFNPRLRGAVIAARAANMPKDKIEAAIKKGASAGEGEDYEEMRYEGYGPSGVAVIVDVLTDNRNRSASDIRSIFNKNGGNLGETGSVNFMFDRIGFVQYPEDKASADEMFEAALEAGAENCEQEDGFHEITCEVEDLNDVRDKLVEKFGDPDTARLAWRPNVNTDVDFETAEKVMKLTDALEDNDDVQYVTTNANISDEIAEQLANAS